MVGLGKHVKVYTVKVGEGGGGSILYGWVGLACQSVHCVSQGVPFIMVGLGKRVKVYTV